MTTVGVLADPVTTPGRVARYLESELPDSLAEHVDADREWHIEVQREQLPPDDDQHSAITGIAVDRMRENTWDIAVCVTDLPLPSGTQPIMADLSEDRRVVVVSLPSFGALRLRRRVREVVVQLIAEIGNDRSPGAMPGSHNRRLPLLGGRFRRVEAAQPGVDVRIVAKRGRLRLLAGMVRDNRPWSLVFGMTGPVVGAVAFSAFFLINSSVWDVAGALGPVRPVIAAVGSILVMMTWLIVNHSLWEPVAHGPKHARDEFARDEAVLFNASMVVTLATGVACMYVGLFGANLVASFIVLPGDVLATSFGGSAGPLEYVVLSVLVASAATVAGAIGSGFETEESIRHAAFSFRERERRTAFREERKQREGSDDDSRRDFDEAAAEAQHAKADDAVGARQSRHAEENAAEDRDSEVAGEPDEETRSPAAAERRNAEEAVSEREREQAEEDAAGPSTTDTGENPGDEDTGAAVSGGQGAGTENAAETAER